MKKQILMISVLFVGMISCSDMQKAIDTYIQDIKTDVLAKPIKNMGSLTNTFNDNTRSIIKNVLGDETYKIYRKVYVKEETARYHAGSCGKKSDKKLSKDEKKLEASLQKTRNKLELVFREKYGDVVTIIGKLQDACKKVIEEHSSK
ncbi:hypothetical protein K9K77_00425 [Candidatus Babeliales bacterium]|nr:hypothetical protein [Candidatus Babeliales bacterium]